MEPNYQIKLYDTSDVLKYTLGESGAYDVINGRAVKNMNSQLGLFDFAVLGSDDTAKYYNDVMPHWKAVFSFGYGSNLTQFLAGRITSVKGVIGNDMHVKQISGLDLGEVLQRRQKTKYWLNTDSHTIVDAIADDLSLAKDTDANSQDETFYTDNTRYFDILKDASDYWIDGSNDVKHDFWVDDVAGTATLKWKTRPVRASGVSTLTIGENIETAVILRDVQSVKNNITVYGAQNRTYPANPDSYCEDVTYWDADHETGFYADTVEYVNGTHSIYAYKNTYGSLDLIYTLPTPVRCGPAKNSYQTLRFWLKRNVSSSDADYPHGLKLMLIPDADSPTYRFETELKPVNNKWTEFNLPLGPDYTSQYEYTPGWMAVNLNNSSWDGTIEQVYFEQTSIDGTIQLWVDTLCFVSYFSGTISDATSISNYGQRDLTVNDTALKSDALCLAKAKTLLYQKKDLPIQADITLNCLDANILLGDRIPLTIAAEDLTAENFDVIQVEQIFPTFKTKTSMINSDNFRQKIIADQNTMLTNLRQQVHSLNGNIQNIGW